MSDEKALASLFSKMARVMGKLDRIEKRGHNQRFNYDYVSSEDVADAVRRAMAEEKLALFVSQGPLEWRTVKTQNGELQIVTVEFTFTFADADSGAAYSCNWRGEAMDGQDKGISKAATSAEKYFLMKTFVLSSGDDPDPDDDENGKNKKQPTTPKPENSRPKPAPEEPEKMSLKTALEVTNSEGVKYGDLNGDTLAGMQNSINKALKTNGLTAEQREQYQFKLAAIQTILKYRATPNEG